MNEPYTIKFIVYNNNYKTEHRVPLDTHYTSFVSKWNFKTQLVLHQRKSIRKTKGTVQEEKRKSIERAVLNKVEDGLQETLFENKGRGVIATKNFKKGDFVVEYAGDLITAQEAKEREFIYSHLEDVGCYMYYFNYKNKRYCVDATEETSRLGRLINHAKNGNISTKTMEVNGVPRLIFIAKEDIAAGCELNYDYGDRSKLSLQYHPWLAL